MEKIDYPAMKSALLKELPGFIKEMLDPKTSIHDTGQIIQAIFLDMTDNLKGFSPEQINEWFAIFRKACNDKVGPDYFYIVMDYKQELLTSCIIIALENKGQVNALINNIRVTREEFGRILYENFDSESFDIFSVDDMARIARNHKYYYDICKEVWW